MPTVDAALSDARARLAASPSPGLDAELLLAHALGAERTRLRARPEETLPATASARFGALLARRAAGEPVAYLIGRRGFHAIELMVSPAVLIPRPETEMLVDVALAELDRRDPEARVVDLGTGSGCIALAIAHQRSDVRITAIESSPEALELARLNGERLGLDGRVAFVAGDWLAGTGEHGVDVIVCNPPYVASGDPHLEHGDLRFEPRVALAGGPDGLDALRAVVADAPAHLATDGLLAVEHGCDQGEAVRALFDAAGLVDVTTRTDPAGHPRVTCGRCVAAIGRGTSGSPAHTWLRR